MDRGKGFGKEQSTCAGGAKPRTAKKGTGNPCSDGVKMQIQVKKGKAKKKSYITKKKVITPDQRRLAKQSAFRLRREPPGSVRISEPLDICICKTSLIKPDEYTSKVLHPEV